MTQEVLERANKLRTQIENLKDLLKGDCMHLWRGFAVHYMVNFGPSQGKDIYHEISAALDGDEVDEVNRKIKDVLEDVLSKKQYELNSL